METIGQALVAARPQPQPQPQPQQNTNANTAVVKTRRPHRPRKDYTNLDTVFNSLEDLKTALRHYIDNASTDAAPEYISCAMTLSSHATLPLKSPLEGPYAQGGPNFISLNALASTGVDDGNIDGGGSSGGSRAAAGAANENSFSSEQFPLKTIQELCDIQELKDRQIWQRAAAKGVVNAIQELDGFKYCFNNNWTSKDDNGYRYSYTCLDSLENKDRHANGFRATNAAKRRPGANTRGVRKPTYDCKGQVAVKFSGVRRTVEVVYKHHPIHKTVAERRPPPRKDSKRKEVSDNVQLDDSTSFDFVGHQDDSYLFGDSSHLTMSPSNPVDPSLPLSEHPIPYPMYHGSHDQDQAKKSRRKTKEIDIPKAKRQKRQPLPNVETVSEQAPQDRPISLAEILQQSMSGLPAAPAPQQSSPAIAPAWPGQRPPQHPGPTGHYQPHPSQQGLLQLGRPQPSPELRDVGRFSKLSVPCFKCKAAHTECDGRQPVCSSCQIRGTVCNYASILRFDKQPTDSGWIQVQPIAPARGAFRVNQDLSSQPPSAGTTGNGAPLES